MAADRFAHLIGKGGEQTNLNFLRNENNALKQEVGRLNNELFNRATPTISNFTDALRTLCLLAQQGNPAALQQVALVVETINVAREVVRAASSKIQLPPGVKPPEPPQEEKAAGALAEVKT